MHTTTVPKAEVTGLLVSALQHRHGSAARSQGLAALADMLGMASEHRTKLGLSSSTATTADHGHDAAATADLVVPRAAGTATVNGDREAGRYPGSVDRKQRRSVLGRVVGVLFGGGDSGSRAQAAAAAADGSLADAWTGFLLEQQGAIANSDAGNKQTSSAPATPLPAAFTGAMTGGGGGGYQYSTPYSADAANYGAGRGFVSPMHSSRVDESVGQQLQAAAANMQQQMDLSASSALTAAGSNAPSTTAGPGLGATAATAGILLPGSSTGSPLKAMTGGSYSSAYSGTNSSILGGVYGTSTAGTGDESSRVGTSTGYGLTGTYNTLGLGSSSGYGAYGTGSTLGGAAGTSGMQTSSLSGSLGAGSGTPYTNNAGGSLLGIGTAYGSPKMPANSGVGGYSALAGYGGSSISDKTGTGYSGGYSGLNNSYLSGAGGAIGAVAGKPAGDNRLPAVTGGYAALLSSYGG